MGDQWLSSIKLYCSKKMGNFVFNYNKNCKLSDDANPLISYFWANCILLFNGQCERSVSMKNSLFTEKLFSLQTLMSVLKHEISVHSAVLTYLEHIAVFVLEVIRFMLMADTVQVCFYDGPICTNRKIVRLLIRLCINAANRRIIRQDYTCTWKRTMCNKLQQTCNNAVPTTCEQDVFALLVPGLSTSCQRLATSLLSSTDLLSFCYRPGAGCIKLLITFLITIL